MKAYEIQTYHNGRWKIDAVFDDRSLAMFEAKRMDEGNRFSGVRVVEEIFEEASQNTVTRTIFRGGRAEQNVYKEENAAAKPQRRGPSPRGGGRERSARGAKRQTSKKGGFAGPLMLLTVLVVAALAALFGLQHLFEIG